MYNENVFTFSPNRRLKQQIIRDDNFYFLNSTCMIGKYFFLFFCFIVFNEQSNSFSEKNKVKTM